MKTSAINLKLDPALLECIRRVAAETSTTVTALVTEGALIMAGRHPRYVLPRTELLAITSPQAPAPPVPSRSTPVHPVAPAQVTPQAPRRHADSPAKVATPAPADRPDACVRCGHSELAHGPRGCYGACPCSARKFKAVEA